MKIKNTNDVSGHRKRVLEKYKKSGVLGWHDYEILEMALFFALPRVDTKSIAKILLDKFGSLNAVVNADVKYLKEINGLGDYAVNYLRFLKDFCIKISEDKLIQNDNKIEEVYLDSSLKVFQFLKVLIGAKKEEEFVLIFLNNKNKVIGFEIIAKGIADEVFVYPRKVVEKVLHYNAVAVILSHNHPTGDLTPSEFDIDFTNRIKLALELIDIALLDHLIISDSKFYSFVEAGIIK